MKLSENLIALVPSPSLQEEFAGVVARAVVEPSRDIESLPLASLGNFVRGRMGESTRGVMRSMGRDTARGLIVKTRESLRCVLTDIET